VCLFSCDVDVQLSHQCFEWRPGDLRLFRFLLFAIFANRLSSILFRWSFHVRLLILAHLMISWISRMLRMYSLRILFCRVLPVMHFKVLIFVVLSRRWLFTLLFQWRRSLQVSNKFYIFLFCSLYTCFSVTWIRHVNIHFIYLFVYYLSRMFVEKTECTSATVRAECWQGIIIRE